MLMVKSNVCPQCGSRKYKLRIPETSLWKCENCGYTGSVVIEDGNLERKVKEARKMDKLQKKLFRGR
ncbi:hypothetical protein [Methanobacterium formicicum]|jgi:ribosomal protein L37AE/L43A|nr:hypothetical protein [Methanobacterium formicicum]MDG3547718.1 hypothetical protein [Methanobacterium formicicum]